MTQIRFRHRVEYATVRFVVAVVRVLPDAAVRGLGAWIGRLFYALDGRHRRLTISQIQTAFPERSESECRTIARDTFAHFGRSLMTLLEFSAFDHDAIRSRIEFQDFDRLKNAAARGKGVIIFTGHFGYWELYGLVHPLVMPPMSVVARQLDNPLLDAMLERMRRWTGNKVIYKRGAVRRILRALQAGETVAMLVDQYSSDADAVTVEYFGRPASTSSAIASLALRTGASIIPMFALPLDNGRYRIMCEPVVELPPAGSPDAVRQITQQCTSVLETYVRRYPHLWLWMHRRWRRPDAAIGRAAEPEMFPAEAPDTAGPEEEAVES